MLYHRDTELDMWAGLGVDAVLCGHAHGGLVRLPGMQASVPEKYPDPAAQR